MRCPRCGYREPVDAPIAESDYAWPDALAAVIRTGQGRCTEEDAALLLYQAGVTPHARFVRQAALYMALNQAGLLACLPLAPSRD